MSNREFGKATAEVLFGMTSWPEGEAGAWFIRDDGVYINEAYRSHSPPGKAFDWTPTYDMDWPGSPDPMIEPLLPIPFNAKQLAACMLDGLGNEIQQALDRRLGDVLDDEALSRFSPRMREVSDAIREAYFSAADAQLKVGAFDYREEDKAQALLSEASDANNTANAREGVFEEGIHRDEASKRRARARKSVAKLESKAEQENAAVERKWVAWRKAMVQQLLMTLPGDEALANEPHPEPVVKETPDERRTRYLAEFEAEVKREKRGALQRLADRKGVDRSNMGKDIKKARELRAMQKRAGGLWASQLVQDGKRTN